MLLKRRGEDASRTKREKFRKGVFGIRIFGIKGGKEGSPSRANQEGEKEKKKGPPRGEDMSR